MPDSQSKTIRVLMINRPDAFSVPGGDTVQMDETKAALERMGVDVRVVLIGDPLPEGGFNVVHVFNWEQLNPYLDFPKSVNLFSLPVVLSTIFWFHTGHWFDAAVTQKTTWRTIRKWLGDPSARSIYERWQQLKFCYGKKGTMLRRSLKHVRQLLPNSEVEMRHFRSTLKPGRNLAYTVIPNGIKKELYDPLPSPNQEFLREFNLEGFVLEVARIQSAKNQKGLIEALMDVPIPIVFIGQPSPYEEEYVRECYKVAEKRGQVYFIPAKSSAELVGIYRLAAVHALPSWRETPGLVSLEAAAAGCKIVTTGLGSAKEYFGEHAWYCDPKDITSIRQAILSALSAPATPALRQLVLERYTWEAAAKKTLLAYRKAIGYA